MSSSVDSDINRGYVHFIRSVSSALNKQKGGMIKSFHSFMTNLIFNLCKLSLVPFLYFYGLLLFIFLRIKLLLAKNKSLSNLHMEATENVSQFISQYPMHLYPIIAKSMEMVFLKKNIRQVVSKVKEGIVELAIGEGTFSSRIFSSDDKLVGFDLNPYSLIHTKRYKHITKRVVADCRNPPIGFCGASFIVCNNFLHHITDKENAIKSWAKIAPYAIFNENTIYWASGWVKPFTLKLVGLNNAAKKETRHMEEHSLQTLWKKEELRSLINQYYDIYEEVSFFNEKAFLLSAVCSALLFCYGPPTPEIQKRVMNSLFGPITKLFTYHIAKTLIEYDAILPRDRDTFICWLVKSKAIGEDFRSGDVNLVCPDCRELLQDNKCHRCDRTFEEKDGMLFLLPKELAEEISYSDNQPNSLREEHL